MPKVTFDASDEQRRLMDRHPEVNWSAVFRQAIERHAKAAELAAQIVDEMADQDVAEMAAKIKASAGARWHAARR